MYIAAAFLMVLFKMLTQCFVVLFFFLYKLIVKSRVLIYTDSDFLQEHFIGILCISTKEHYTCFSFSLSISLYFSFLLTIVAYCLDSLFPWGIMKP